MDLYFYVGTHPLQHGLSALLILCILVSFSFLKDASNKMHYYYFWTSVLIRCSYWRLLRFVLPQLPSEPVYHPALRRQVDLCSQQCCDCTLLPFHYKRWDFISDSSLAPSDTRECVHGTGLDFVQEMCCWVPFSWLWPRTSPSILSACVLQRCSISCRYWIVLPPPPPPPHGISSVLIFLYICGVLLLRSVSTSPSTSGEPVSGGSSRSMPLSTWAVSLSSLASPFFCLAHGTTCSPSMASCEWKRKRFLLSFQSCTAHWYIYFCICWFGPIWAGFVLSYF